MSLSRRQTISLIGGGVIAAATAAAGLAVTRKPRDALAAWGQAGTYRDPRKRALSYAILAPNPHNRQPWLVDLRTPAQAALYVDPTRLLPHTDPFNRQITVGLGCFLETLRLAALQDGLEVVFDLFPEGFDDTALDDRPVAICHFAKTEAAPDPLFAQVPHRRTLKEAYDTSRPLAEADLAAIAHAAMHGPVRYSVAPDDIDRMRALSAKAIEIEFATPRTYRESVDLFRIGAREVNANPDGIAFSGPMFETLNLTGMFTREAALAPEGMVKRQGLELVQANMATGMGYLWQVSATNTRLDQIRAGQDWMRINLAATARGIGIQPLSQALQEFPEMAPLFDQAQAMLAPEGGVVQMWARLGYGPDVPHSPRWPLEAKLIGA